MRRRPFRHRTRIRVGERKPRAINTSPPRFFAIFLFAERARDRGSRRVAGMRRRAPRATAQVLLRSPSRPFLGKSMGSKRFEPAEAKSSGAPWHSRFAVALFRTGRPVLDEGPKEPCRPYFGRAEHGASGEAKQSRLQQGDAFFPEHCRPVPSGGYGAARPPSSVRKRPRRDRTSRRGSKQVRCRPALRRGRGCWRC
jgi:hypothetical protein